MPRIRITDAVVAKLSATKQTFYSDQTMPSFQVGVGPTAKVYYATGRVAGTSKVVRVKLGKHPSITATAAKRAAQAAIANLERGLDPHAPPPADPDAPPTLAAVLDSYIETRMAGSHLSAPVAKQYRDALAKHCSGLLAKPVDEITKPEVRALHIKHADKPHLANQVIRIMRSLFDFAIDTLDVDMRNPTRGIDPHKPKKPKAADDRRHVRAADLPEWYAAVSAIPNATRRAYWLVAALTGIRRRNLAALRWEHVDLDAGTIWIERTKNGTEALLPISTEVVRLLRELHAERSSSWVFSSNSKSGHIEEPKEDGVRWTIHGCRHIFTTAGASCLLPEYVLKRLRGDIARSDAKDAYVHDIDSHDAVNRIAEHLMRKWGAV